MRKKRVVKLDFPFPEGTEGVHSAEELTARFQVPPDYPFLEGHFPGYPIVPAVAQIGWFLSAVAILHGSRLGPYRLSRLKFTQPVLPEEEITLLVEGRGGSYRYHLQGVDGLKSSGLFLSTE